jgi:hypothetical protein
VQIILFGSRARGTARPDSAVDLLVVLPEAPDRRAAKVALEEGQVMYERALGRSARGGSSGSGNKGGALWKAVRREVESAAGRKASSQHHKPTIA